MAFGVKPFAVIHRLKNGIAPFFFRKVEELTTQSFFALLFKRRVGGQILSLPCGSAFYILRVITTIKQLQPMDFLMFIGVC